MQLRYSCIYKGGARSLPKKDDLLEKIFRKSIPKNFTVSELDTLMRMCGCKKCSGGRGSAIAYIHEISKRKLIFDGPHPGKELYSYQIKMVRKFIEDIGEV